MESNVYEGISGEVWVGSCVMLSEHCQRSRGPDPETLGGNMTTESFGSSLESAQHLSRGVQLLAG